MNDFRKYATKHLGINGMVLDDVVSQQAQYLNPYILEERQLNVTQMDVFSRLMMDRIIFLGTQIDDYTANTLQAQLLYLDSVDPGKDISIYINSPGGRHLRHYAVYLERRGNHLHRYGGIYGSRAPRGRSGRQAFGIAPQPCDDSPAAWWCSRTGF